MGVQGLWQLLHPAGKPVSPSSLEGKVLAVDVSIWLHQTLKGMRDKDGNPLPNAHLQGLFTRICKLLFYRIRPVFVFDGGAPALKKQTLALRRERKDQVDKEKGRTTQKLLQNLLRTQAVSGVLGEESVQIDIPSKREPDIFQLPPLPEVDKDFADPLENAGAWEIDFDREETRRRRPHLDIIRSLEDNLQNLDDINFESPEFENLPPEVKHEILTEMKEQRKERALARFVDMPEVSEDFSSFQLKKLIKQSKLSGKIESVRKEMNERTSGDITYALGDDYYGEVVEANRVVSEDASHYILIKGLTRKQQMAQAEKCKVEVISDEEAQGDFGQEGRKGRSMQTGKSASNKRVKFEDEESTDSHHPKHSQVCDNTLGCVLDDDFNSDIDVSPVPKKKIKQEKTSDDEELETKQNSDDDVDSFDDKFSTHLKKIKDELSSDDEEIKTRRQRRGKALLKKNSSGELGVNNAAKNRKGKFKPHCKKIVISDDDSDDLLQQSIPHSVNSLPSITSKDTFLITVKTTASEVDISTVAGHEKLASNGNEMVDCVGPTIGNGEGDSDVMEAENDDFEETRQKLISEEEELNREREAKMAALMKSLEKRTEISVFSSQLSPPESQPLEEEKSTEETEEKSTEETIEKLLLEEERLAREKESKMAALLQSIEKRSKLKSAQDLAIDTSSPKNETQSETENYVHDTEQNLKSSFTLPLQRGKGKKEVGFLEDVAKAERKIIQRRNRSKHSSQEVEAQSEPNHSKRVVPVLSVEYLEDVESMLAVQNENTSVSSPVENTDKVASDNTVDLDKKPKDDGLEMTADNLDNLTYVQESATEKPRKRKQKTLTERAKSVGRNMKRKRALVTRRGTATVEAAAEKKAKIGEPSAEPVRISAETEESEDEGFIEITVDLTKAQEDDLFPASIFEANPDLGFNTQQHQASTKHDVSNKHVVATKDVAATKHKVDIRDDIDSDIFARDTTMYENGHKLDTTKQKVVSKQVVTVSASDDSSDAADVIVEDNRQSIADDDVESEDDAQLIEENRLVRESLETVAEVGGASATKLHTGSKEENTRKVQKKNEEEESVTESEDQSHADADSEAGFSPLHSGNEDEKSKFLKGVKSLPDLYGLQRELVSERRTLTTERGRQARLGKSVTEQINLEAQELLQLFGIPYVVSPMEAESQCAYLELAGLTQGTITDDSDAWLFGAQNVYKNFFNQTKFVEFYTAHDVLQRFGLDRQKLINIALLCGSDYTPGIPGVGPVRAMEILAEFPGDGLEGLQAFREWWGYARAGLVTQGVNKIKNKLRELELHEGFPSRQVLGAYLHPAVDESEETFTWGSPDVELLRQYAKEKFGWNRQKADDVIVPMMKEFTKKMVQGRIHKYFQPENFLRPKPVQSKRLQRALDKFRGNNSSSGSESTSSGSESESESESDPELPQLDFPNPGEGVIAKANKLLAGSAARRARGTFQTRGRGQRGGKSEAQKPEVKGQRSEVKGQKGRGRGGGPVSKVTSQRGKGRNTGGSVQRTANPKAAVLREEVSLSESSSCDESDSEIKGSQKKTVVRKEKPNKTLAPQDNLQAKPVKNVSKPVKNVSKSVKKAKSNVGDTAANLRPVSGKARQISKGAPKNAKQKVQSKPVVSTADSAAFKAALGLDFDPSMMTIDDLGSDFSDEC